MNTGVTMVWFVDTFLNVQYMLERSLEFHLLTFSNIRLTFLPTGPNILAEKGT